MYRGHGAGDFAADLHQIRRYVGIVGALEVASVQEPVSAIGAQCDNEDGGNDQQTTTTRAVAIIRGICGIGLGIHDEAPATSLAPAVGGWGTSNVQPPGSRKLTGATERPVCHATKRKANRRVGKECERAFRSG